MTSDEGLVLLLRSGETVAFDELYRRYNRRLFSYILHMVEDSKVAEDLLQEVFLTVVRQSSFTLQETKFSAWLFTVARNQSLSYLRARHVRAEFGPVSNVNAGMTHTNITQVPPNGEQQVEEAEKLTAVQLALKDLSSDHRETFLLKTVGGFTYREIAAVQGVAVGTVKSRLFAAIQQLRLILAPFAD